MTAPGLSYARHIRQNFRLYTLARNARKTWPNYSAGIHWLEMNLKQVKCGCEFNADTLVSLCGSHAAYFSEKFRREAPEIVPLNAKQEALRNQLLVAAIPAALNRAKAPASIDKMAGDLVKLATCIAART